MVTKATLYSLAYYGFAGAAVVTLAIGCTSGAGTSIYTSMNVQDAIDLLQAAATSPDGSRILDAAASASVEQALDKAASWSGIGAAVDIGTTSVAIVLGGFAGLFKIASKCTQNTNKDKDLYDPLDEQINSETKALN